MADPQLHRFHVSCPHYLAVADPGFSQGGCSDSQIGIILQIFAEKCMKMKEFGPRRASLVLPTLDPPMPRLVLAARFTTDTGTNLFSH